MKCWYQKGFTIVEISIVLAVVSVLALITVVANNQVQLQARDKSRQADMLVLTSGFEKYYQNNGMYPTGCSWGTAITSCRINAAIEPPGDIAFYSNTNKTSIQSALQLEQSTLNNTKSTPLSSYISSPSTNAYFFWGQQENSGGTPLQGINLAVGTTSPLLNCDPSITIFRYSYLPPTGNSFVLGYYGEVDKKWHIYQGDSGKRLVIYSTGEEIRSRTIGQCIFEN
jgi:prepilin-type N-terminal cleavage/methylation domain-containing protein